MLPWEFRLRPFWIAPHTTADYDTMNPSSPQVAQLVAELTAKMKPVWQLVSKIEKTLSAASVAVLQELAAGVGVGTTTEALVRVLREHGGSFWVEATNARARRLTGNPDLDDDVNELPFVMLRDSLFRRHGVEFVSLESALADLSPAIGDQFTRRGCVTDGSAPLGFRWRSEEEVQQALMQRTKHFDFKKGPDGLSLMIARHSAFRQKAAGGGTPSPSGTPATSSWAKFCR